MKNPFIELCGCMCLTLLAPQPAAAKTAGEVPPADTLRTVFFTDIHVTPGNAQDSLFRIAVAEANASDADLVIFGGDLTNMGSDRELAHVHGLMSQLRKPWFTVRRGALELPNGNRIPDYYVLEYPDWVNVIAVT